MFLLFLFYKPFHIQLYEGAAHARPPTALRVVRSTEWSRQLRCRAAPPKAAAPCERPPDRERVTRQVNPGPGWDGELKLYARLGLPLEP